MDGWMDYLLFTMLLGLVKILSLIICFWPAADVSGGEAESPAAVGSGRRLYDGQTVRLSFLLLHTQTHRTQFAPRGPQQDLPR